MRTKVVHRATGERTLAVAFEPRAATLGFFDLAR